MLGWSIKASACRSASNRASTARESMPHLDQLERHLPLDRFGLLGPVDGAHPPLAEEADDTVGTDAVGVGERAGAAVDGGPGWAAPPDVTVGSSGGMRSI